MSPQHARSVARLVGLCAFVAIGSVLLGHKIGSERAFIRDRRLAEGPEALPEAPAEWRSDGAGVSPASDVTSPETPLEDQLIVVDMTKPVRITWPLDVGPELNRLGDTPRTCLRARQGVSELQTAGDGKALYGFRVDEPGSYETWFRVRWGGDGTGSVMCDNSWFAGIDDQPLAVIGNETKERDWFWQAGPAVELTDGPHWLRVELREDGPAMDKVAIVPADTAATPEMLERAKAVAFAEFAGMRFPGAPQYPIADVEIQALPTDSLAIAQNHVNKVTVLVSYQGRSTDGFTGRIDINCPTAPGLVVHGEANLVCTPAEAYVARDLVLEFPDDAPRRAHRTTVTVSDEEGECVFRTEIRFVKGYAWAFLGPFRDTSNAQQKLYRYTGTVEKLAQPCDANPLGIAKLGAPNALALDELPLLGGHDQAEWRVVDDGSCYDWTGAVDLQRVYGPSKPAFAYAVTWINAETVLHHRSFNLQVDDSGWLWVNGHTVVQLPIDLPKEANRLWTSVPLKKGANPVVVKLTQNKAYWGFRFDVIDWHWQGRRGDVITGVEHADWPR